MQKLGSFIYGLAVALLLFEGIIIQCEGGGDRGKNEIEKGFMPNDLIKKIFYRINNEGRVEIFNNLPNEPTPPEDVMPDHLMDVLLKKCIILIQTKTFDAIASKLKPEELFASYEDKNSEVNLIIGNYDKLVLFLKNYGKHAVKIHIGLFKSCKTSRILYDIKEYAKNLEELQIATSWDDANYEKHSEFWKAISNIEFPSVKNVTIVDLIERTDFKLDRIFPKLENFFLYGDVRDENCLENVTKLKELALHSRSIPESKLDSIYRENNGITNLGLHKPSMRKTLESIVQHLKDLKSLEAFCPEKSFLLREGNAPLCELPKVENLFIFLPYTCEVYEIDKLAFEMPKLQELTLHGNFKDKHFIEFFEHFKELKTVRLAPIDDVYKQLMAPTWTLSKSIFIRGVEYSEFTKSGKK